MSISANLHNVSRMEADGGEAKISWLSIHDATGNRFVVFMPFDLAGRLARTFDEYTAIEENWEAEVVQVR